MQHYRIQRVGAILAVAVTLICCAGLMGCGGGSGSSGSVSGYVLPPSPTTYSASGAFNNGLDYSFNYKQVNVTGSGPIQLPTESGISASAPDSTMILKGTMTAFGNTFPIEGYQDASGNQHLSGTLTTAGGLGFNLTFTIDNIQGTTTVTASGTNMAGTQPVNLTSTTQTASKP